MKQQILFLVNEDPESSKVDASSVVCERVSRSWILLHICEIYEDIPMTKMRELKFRNTVKRQIISFIFKALKLNAY